MWYWGKRYSIAEQIKEKDGAKANTPEIVLSAHKVSAYVAPIKESNILTAANIIKKRYIAVL